MRIQHNIMAMNAYRNYNTNTSALSKNLEKLSSGYKINRAGDDAAGLAISEKMRAQIKGLEAAQKNVKDGTSLVKTAEGAMQEIQDMLGRMKYLATQSSNGTYDNEVDRKALQDEVDQLKDEINRIADSANFNGIKLLDGSLSTKGANAAASVKVAGNANAEYSTGKEGKYEASKFALDTNMTNWKGTGTLGEGDTFEYGVHLSDGTGYTARVTAKKDSEGNFYLEGESGAKYTLATKEPTKVKVQVSELDKALRSELQKTGLSDQYVINTDGAGAFTFTAKEEGTAVPAVLAVDYASTDASDAANNRVAGKAIGVTVPPTDQPRDVGYEIKADDIIEYNGKNYENAVFTINGKKFVLLTEQMNGKTSTTEAAKNKPENATAADDEYLRAVQALGSDVTVLVGGQAGLKNVAGADDNFKQNIAKIAEVTGLTVTDTIAGDDNNINVGEGIRLSAGKGNASGGLQLQIGDTADSYNQLRVSVNDMHTKALGIDDLNIGTPEGATAAIETVMKAINSVSSTRGTLGAIQNRLDHTANNLSVMVENITDAESSIRDTDVAEEMMAYTKNNILIQSAQAMLAQANAVPQGVLQLLQ